MLPTIDQAQSSREHRWFQIAMCLHVPPRPHHTISLSSCQIPDLCMRSEARPPSDWSMAERRQVHIARRKDNILGSWVRLRMITSIVHIYIRFGQPHEATGAYVIHVVHVMQPRCTLSRLVSRLALNLHMRLPPRNANVSGQPQMSSLHSLNSTPHSSRPQQVQLSP